MLPTAMKGLLRQLLSLETTGAAGSQNQAEPSHPMEAMYNSFKQWSDPELCYEAVYGFGIRVLGLRTSAFMDLVRIDGSQQTDQEEAVPAFGGFGLPIPGSGLLVMVIAVVIA